MNRTLSSPRAAAILMAALAMVLKLVFAPGLMPSVDAHGAARLVICTAQGAKVIADASDHDGARQKPCPFEGQGAVIPAQTPQPLRIAAAEYPASTRASETTVRPGGGLAAPPPPSTGPPSQFV